ncbi:MAG: FAD-dependent oxidoreductase [Haloarculaceae archaeon]
MGNRFLVVGGDAAGMSAAGKALRDDPDREVVVFEQGEWVAYGACGLPYYEAGVVDDLSDLVVVDPAEIEARGIDLRRGHDVVDVDADARTVTVAAADGRYEAAYDDLLLATGGRATFPDVPGADLAGAFAVRNLAAGRALHNYVVPEERPPVAAVEAGYGAALRRHLATARPAVAGVIGANKIGLEMAEAFLARGLDVHVFESGSQVLPAFGAAAAGVVADHLREQGVTLHLDATVEALAGTGGRVAAVETDVGRVPVDVVLVDVGIEPNVDLAQAAGAALGETGAVAVDEYGETSVPHVYAAGDCAEKHHLLADGPVRWPYALAANRAGRAIGATVAGDPTPVGSIVGTGVMKTFDLEVARTGLLDAEARTAGFDPVSKTITTITRAHYYPGWSRIVVHAVCDRTTGRFLGASLVGREGAAHRINSVAGPLHAGMTVDEVGALDFGYAPPFGPVWDPVLAAARALSGDLS